MPELPEVETIRRDLAKSVLGKKIREIKILSAKTISPSSKKFLSLLTG